MRTRHKIFIDCDDEIQKTLMEFGITVEKGFSSFEIDEGDVYEKLKPLLIAWEASEKSSSFFSKSEEDSAKLLTYLPASQRLYPQSAGDRGYRKTTYDDTDYCKKCGLGAVQKEPFRVTGKPTWGNKMFLLFWIFDEIFCQKDFYEQVLKKYKFDFLPLLRYGKDTVIEDTVQLILPTTNTALNLDGYKHQTCEVCGRERYDLITTGVFPPFEKEIPDDLHLFKSKEWFGAGASSRKYLFITQKLREELIKHKVRGVYHPQRE